MGGPIAFFFPEVAFIDGQNRQDFTILKNTCGTILAPYANCAITFSFTPTAAGQRTAIIRLDNNGIENPGMISLSGLGR